MIVAEYNGVIFTAQENGEPHMVDGVSDCCAGCVFDSASVRHCFNACAAAEAVGLLDCDHRGPKKGNVIYVRTSKGDPRQADLAGPVEKYPRQMALVD